MTPQIYDGWFDVPSSIFIPNTNVKTSQKILGQDHADMDDEKHQSKDIFSPAHNDEVLEQKDSNLIGEAEELYGYVGETYVHRGLKSRHVQFIALAGTIGTGLFLGIGSAL